MSAVAAVAGLGAIASANITVSTLRTTDLNLPGYDAIQVFATNDGTGVDGGLTGILSVSMTITDQTGPHLLLGVNTDGLGTYFGDPDGSSMSSGNLANPNDSGQFLPVYNTLSYPTPAGTGVQKALGYDELYSWVGYGYKLNTLNWSNAKSIPSVVQAGSVVASGYLPQASLHVEGGWSNVGGVDAGATTGKGTSYNGTGAFIGVAVVPTGDVVNFTGEIGGTNVGSRQSYNVTNPSAPVPEPASVGVLVLGSMALLARRRK
jgi:hypothetical protein